jgi:hypothetical protein
MSTHKIELKLQTVHQLFNSMDPSPFHERDLDHDAETFIESWAQECPAKTDIRIIIHLAQPADEPPGRVAESIHNFFKYKAELNRNDLRRLFREGWESLIIGIAFLVICETLAHTLAHGAGEFARIFSEGLVIVGWVAMWRPLEIYLYRWWPILRLGRVLRKLAAAEVEMCPALPAK